MSAKMSNYRGMFLASIFGIAGCYCLTDREKEITASRFDSYQEIMQGDREEIRPVILVDISIKELFYNLFCDNRDRDKCERD